MFTLERWFQEWSPNGQLSTSRISLLLSANRHAADALPMTMDVVIQQQLQSRQYEKWRSASD